MFTTHILNSSGELDELLDMIDQAMAKFVDLAGKNLPIENVDIVFTPAPYNTIPEQGVGGYTPTAHLIYISLDPESDKLTLEHLVDTLLHESHHTVRWRNPGYGETLIEAMVTEGLACLYEEQITGNKPIYADVELKQSQIERAKQELGSKTYSHNDWFFGGDGIDRWFGYTYGYKICWEYSELTGKSAAELASVLANEIAGQLS